MKKLLAIISSTGLFASTTTSLISCNSGKETENNTKLENVSNELSDDMEAAIGENLIESGIDASGLDESSTVEDAVEVLDEQAKEIDSSASVTLVDEAEENEELDEGENHIEVKYKKNKNDKGTTLNAEVDGVKKEHIDKSALEDLINDILTGPIDGSSLNTNNDWNDTLSLVDEQLHSLDHEIETTLSNEKTGLTKLKTGDNKISVKFTDEENNTFTKEITINKINAAPTNAPLINLGSFNISPNIKIDSTKNISSNKIDENAKFAEKEFLEDTNKRIKQNNLSVDEEEYKKMYGTTMKEEIQSKKSVHPSKIGNKANDKSLSKQVETLVPHTKESTTTSNSKTGNKTGSKKNSKKNTTPRVAKKHREIINSKGTSKELLVPVKKQDGTKGNLKVNVNTQNNDQISNHDYAKTIADIFKSDVNGSSLKTNEKKAMALPLIKTKLHILGASKRFDVDFTNPKTKNELLKPTNKLEVKIWSQTDKSMKPIKQTITLNNVQKPKSNDYSLRMVPKEIDAKIWRLNTANTWKDVTVGIIKTLHFTNIKNYSVKIDKKSENSKLKVSDNKKAFTVSIYDKKNRNKKVETLKIMILNIVEGKITKSVFNQPTKPQKGSPSKSRGGKTTNSHGSKATKKENNKKIKSLKVNFLFFKKAL